MSNLFKDWTRTQREEEELRRSSGLQERRSLEQSGGGLLKKPSQRQALQSKGGSKIFAEEVDRKIEEQLKRMLREKYQKILQEDPKPNQGYKFHGLPQILPPHLFEQGYDS